MLTIRKYRHLFIFIAALAVSCSGCYYFIFQKEDQQISRDSVPLTPSLVEVTLVQVSPGMHPGLVRAHGQVEPKEEITVRSAATGQVVWISDRLSKGQIVRKGEILARINPVAYQSRLAQAELSLSNARLNFIRESQEAKQANENWSRSGFSGPPDSELVLRKPQMAIAKRQIDSALANVELAQNELEYCTIRSPLNALVTERFISAGEWVSQTDKIAHLFGTDTAQIEFFLDSRDVLMLNPEYYQNSVLLMDKSYNVSWPARLVSDGKRLLPESRLRPFICQVDDPMNQNPPLLAGHFVAVKIIGKMRSNLLKLPQSCLTPKGRVWFKNAHDNTLNHFTAQTVFFNEGHVFVKAPENASFPIQIAVYPNQSFKTGLRILPRVEHKKG